MVPTARTARPSRQLIRLRTGLYMPQSLLPGNGFLPSETNGAKPPPGSDSRLRRPTAFAQSPHVAVIHGQFEKSPFDRECVVGLGGLELPTQRLSTVALSIPSSSEVAILHESTLSLQMAS